MLGGRCPHDSEGNMVSRTDCKILGWDGIDWNPDEYPAFVPCPHCDRGRIFSGAQDFDLVPALRCPWCGTRWNMR